MIERTVDIATKDGAMETFIVHPERGGAYPVVMLMMDAPGIREELRMMARRLATVGYYVLLPNLYYRAGVMEIGPLGDTSVRERMMELMNSLTIALIMDDTDALMSRIHTDPAADGRRVGAVGYCMGGGMAMRTAAAEPANVAAAASFHGSQLASDAPDSPHLLAPKIKAQLYFGFAIEDRSMPPEAVEKLKAALDTAGVNYEAEVYAGARHGWCVKDHTVYHEHQAEHAWHHLVEFFKATLQ